MPVASRFQPFGTTVFSEMTQLAVKHQAVNLSQGFPDFDGPAFVRDAAIEAIRAGHNQYARMFGIPPLNDAIAARWNRLTGQNVDPNTQIQVTAGCTQAIPSVCLGLLNPGDEVIVFEPYYDSYRPCLAMADAVPRFVPLRWPDYSFDRDEVANSITDRTRAILINTPHNPTGKVYTRDELEFLADVCIRHDLLAITDEVYENLVFDGEHIRMATLPGMADRTITLSSLGKSFSLTGWKIGWVIASPDVIQGVRAAHQFLTFAVATPLQHGAVAALTAPETYYEEFVSQYRGKRDFLCEALEAIGFSVARPAGTYFILADHTPFGFDDDVAFCRHLVEEIGVAAIPPSAFYEHKEHGRSLVRFAFCKTDETLQHAVERLSALRPA
ncbi:MAG: aminotransferase class I/II-fold pyridoxal phosphate-dependent enzyme [Planctomycetes bacterium]|nr:aminotransferase class I/II-fold pyridoxal phosphate-dependent enzyme [Planctomycetota bacterium]NOG52832.1 aminotransferase class I/II-fold pyridoxal phosphate-dependent enzyme [Planctomycetota bacterium]